MKDLINKKVLIQLVNDMLEKKVVEQIGSGYSNPLQEMVNEVIRDNADNLKSKISVMLAGVFDDKDFTKIVNEEFKHKVAKSLVGKLEGTVERSVEALRQDPTIKAKMVLAIENIVNKHS